MRFLTGSEHCEGVMIKQKKKMDGDATSKEDSVDFMACCRVGVILQICPKGAVNYSLQKALLLHAGCLQ